MKSVVSKLLCLVAIAGTVAAGVAQEKPSGPTASTNDPRVGLKPGLRDAGTAIRGMELLSSLPKPEGFFDPKNPGGTPTPAETPEPPATTAGAPATPAEPAPATTPPATGAAPAEGAARRPGAQGGGGGGAGLNFANSDLRSEEHTSEL